MTNINKEEVDKIINELLEVLSKESYMITITDTSGKNGRENMSCFPAINIAFYLRKTLNKRLSK